MPDEIEATRGIHRRSRYVLAVLMLSMSLGPKNVTAGMTKLNDGVNTSLHHSVSAAYTAIAGENSPSISVQAGTFREDVTFTRSGPVTLKGGYDANFEGIVGKTSIEGTLTVRAGSVRVNAITLTSPRTGPARIIYLHHSTGSNIWYGGVPEFITTYNNSHGTDYQIAERAYPDSPYPWENYPYDYWKLWVDTTGPAGYQEQDTLDTLTANYDVIVFKHCFPVSDIEEDIGSPDVSSSRKSLENYRVQYNALKARMRQFPANKFIVWTGAALTQGATNPGNAERARQFFEWVRTSWDEPGDNIFVWDLWTLETEGGLYFRTEYANNDGDPHPNGTFAAFAAPLIGQRIVDVIEGAGDSGHITGQQAALRTDIMPEARGTDWKPGIPGGIPTVTAIHTTINDAAYGNGIADAGPVINAAIQAAGDVATESNRQVVYLPAGVYRTTEIINVNRSNVVLRGAGPALTRIRLDLPGSEGSPAIRFGIFWPEYTGLWNVTGSIAKGASSFTVSDAGAIQAGDVLQIDQQDDSYVALGDGHYSKRQPATDVNGPGTGAADYTDMEHPGGPWRSVGQQVEVTGKNGNTLTIAGQFHSAYDAERLPQVFKTATAREGEPGTRFAGIENLYVTGGSNNNIDAANLAYCWIRNIESDGNPATGPAGSFTYPAGMDGEHINLLHSYRCEVRGSYIHHARNINQGGTAYGISISTQSSGNLIEDNIVVHLNKPIVMNNSGGGNVIAYNYVDNAYSTGYPGWQETAIDGNHQAFSHHDLFEGNWTPNIGSDSTHGNSGWHTFFRNYVTGRNSSPPAPDDGNVRAVGIDGYNREHTIIGNVLLQPDGEVNGYAPVYDANSADLVAYPAIYRIGAASLGGDIDSFDNGTALNLLYRHGNYDSVTNSVIWDSGNSRHLLPNSLYLTGKPEFFGNNPWPWVEPAGTTKVHLLPAKARYDAMP